jgi:hypothetical protein
MESAGAESCWERLTQENPLSRLVLLNLVLTCGNFLETLHCRKAESDDFLSFSADNEQLPGDTHLSGLPIPAPKRSAEALGDG